MKLIILDRDGVINFDSPDYIKTPEEWKPIPGSLEAIGQLKQAGFSIAIATNQSGIARGLYTEAMLIKIHDKMLGLLKELGASIDKITYCPHMPEVQCECRKPKPGLLHQIAEHFDCSLDDIPVVGDRYTDVQVARAVNAKPILVTTGWLDELNKCRDDLHDVAVFDDLAAVVEDVLS